jgi:hypothetical protein
MVRDNPETFVDLDGHEEGGGGDGSGGGSGTGSTSSPNPAGAQGATQGKSLSTTQSGQHSIGGTKEVNAVNEKDTDKSLGMTATTKIFGGSITGSASANTNTGTANASAGADVHGLDSKLNFSSDPHGGPGLVNGTVGLTSFTAGANASAGTNGVSARAEASVVSFSGTLNVGRITVTGTVNAVSAGGQFQVSSNVAALGLNALVGADLKIQWSNTTVASVSGEAH